MRPKLHVRTGDTVEVITGASRGQRGRILRCIPPKGRVVIEGINMVWKHMRRSQQHPRGGRVQVEAAIAVSNVMLICPNRECTAHDKPVRARRVIQDDGSKIRTCAKCGHEIPKAV